MAHLATDPFHHEHSQEEVLFSGNIKKWMVVGYSFNVGKTIIPVVISSQADNCYSLQDSKVGKIEDYSPLLIHP